MKKVEAEIQFTSPCLGHIPDKTQSYYALPRDASGDVVIMQGWIKAMLRKAAEQSATTALPFETLKLIGDKSLLETATVHSTDVMTKDFVNGKKITYDCIVAGTKIVLKFLVPFGIKASDLAALIFHSGKFIGMSPRHACEGYGRFELLRWRVINPGKEDTEEKSNEQANTAAS